MPLIPFPDVPQFPGVPVLPTQPGSTPTSDFGPLLTADDPNINSIVAPAQWGIFDGGGNPIIEADSVIAVEFSKEYRTCDYPVEPGSTDAASGNTSSTSSFESYNKVELPFDFRVTFAKGGNDDDRRGFLSNVQSITGNTNLYTVNTPDAVYVNANIVKYSYRRTAQNGVSLILVEVDVREIRVTNGVTALSNTADPASADPASGGQVYPQSPTPSQATAAQ